MKVLAQFIFFFSFFSLCAQEQYLEDRYEVKDPVTRTYATKDGEDLKLDIYEPADDESTARPLIVFMHGGGFAGGTPKNEGEVKFAKMAAKKGYVAVQIAYRLTRKGQGFGCDFAAEGKIETFRKAAEDFLDAVRYMKDHSEEFKINDNQIIVGGSSAGAEAVLDATYNRELLFENPEKYEDLNFSGVFSLAGAIVDARYITEQEAIPAVLFHGTSDNLVPYSTAPHHFCSPDKPGYLILDGSKTIAEKLQTLDTSYMLYTFEGAGHEISGMPFEDMPEIFDFFSKVFLENEHLQINVTK